MSLEDESKTKVAFNRTRESTAKRLILTGVLVVANVAILYVLFLFLPSGSPFLDWAPGILFGLAFAWINMKTRSEVISFTLLSGIAYWLAVEVAAWAAAFGFDLSSTPKPWLIEFLKRTIHVATPFCIGGVIGAAILMVSLKFLSKNRLSGYDVLTVLVGALTGFAFGKVVPNYNFPWPAFLIWQLPVALTLALSVPWDSVARDATSHSSRMDRISRFLQTPIFVIIGTIVNLVGLFDFIYRLAHIK